MDDSKVAILKQSIKNNSNDKLFERVPLCLYSLNKNSAFKLRMTMILILSNGGMYTFVIKMVKLKCPLPAVLLAFISGLSAFCVAGTAFIEKGTAVACQKENLQKTRTK